MTTETLRLAAADLVEIMTLLPPTEPHLCVLLEATKRWLADQNQTGEARGESGHHD
jgi:hypothetical protein